MAGLLPLAGNLFHHAAEMFLKGQLSKTTPLDCLKKKYSHNLVKTWEAFKALFPSEDLAQV
jgi:hypothetical protein